MKKLEERIAALEKAVFGKNIVIKNGNFELAGLQWTVLDKVGENVLCLADRLPENYVFGSDCNNWSQSGLRNYLNTNFYAELVEKVGGENIMPIHRDLTSLDGQTDYGSCQDKVGF